MSEENPWHPYKSMWDTLHNGAIKRRRDQQYEEDLALWMRASGVSSKPLSDSEHYNDDETALD